MRHKQQSIWEKETELPSFPPINQHMKTDVCVVGGGITGITTAYELARIGLQVIVVDAYKLGSGTTGRTTAKITAQHGLIYDKIIQSSGIEHAAHYFQSANDGGNLMMHHMEQLNMDVQLEKKTSTVYTVEDPNVKKIEDELNAYEKIGIKGSFSDSIELPIQIKAAIHLPNQLQFHPFLYMKNLIEACVENGVQFFEDSLAIDIEHSDQLDVRFDQGQTVSCTYVVQATHFPFYDPVGMFTTRLIPERSFLYAGIDPDVDLTGMYVNCDTPSRTVRSIEKGFLIGGEGFDVGKNERKENPYDQLKMAATKIFPNHTFVTEWSAQDYDTVDSIPYIGRLKNKHENIFVATGFKKWGMTTSATAALLITDLIQGRTSPYEKIYSPSRFNVTTSIPTFVKQNTQVAANLIKGKVRADEDIDYVINELQANEATTLFHDGKKIGVFKDESQTVHAVDTTCTHLGCEVEWNTFDLTWDCPCHGSRYLYSGEVIEGPAKFSLKKQSL